MNLAHEHDDWDRGLAHDLHTMVERRRALKVFAGAGAAAFLAACANDSSSSATIAETTIATAECTTVVPSETAGPFPGDGSNGPDILTEPDVVRSDITGSIGSFTGTAEGVPTSISLTILDSANGCKPLAGGAVYLWHVDKDGLYSMYTAPDASYLRGVQVADATGTVTFQSIWPGCYPGRWPHVHFEVFPSLDDALSANNGIVTSQIALPEAECAIAYAASGYETSVSNLSSTSPASDVSFSDGWDQQLASATGSNDAGWAIALTITV